MSPEDRKRLEAAIDFHWRKIDLKDRATWPDEGVPVWIEAKGSPSVRLACLGKNQHQTMVWKDWYRQTRYRDLTEVRQWASAHIPEPPKEAT